MLAVSLFDILLGDGRKILIPNPTDVRLVGEADFVYGMVLVLAECEHHHVVGVAFEKSVGRKNIQVHSVDEVFVPLHLLLFFQQT